MKKTNKKLAFIGVMTLVFVAVASSVYAYLKYVSVTQKTATVKAPEISSVNGGTLSASVVGGSNTTDTARVLPIITCDSYTSAADCSGATNYNWTTVSASNGDIDNLKISIIKDSNELDGALVFLLKAFPNFTGQSVPTEGVFMKIENSDLAWHTNSAGKLQSEEIDLGFGIPSGNDADITLNYYLDATKMEQLAAQNKLPDSTKNVQIYIEYSGETHAME